MGAGCLLASSNISSRLPDTGLTSRFATRARRTDAYKAPDLSVDWLRKFYSGG
jgi:hypothetical protein